MESRSQRTHYADSHPRSSNKAGCKRRRQGNEKANKHGTFKLYNTMKFNYYQYTLPEISGEIFEGSHLGQKN